MNSQWRKLTLECSKQFILHKITITLFCLFITFVCNLYSHVRIFLLVCLISKQFFRDTSVASHWSGLPIRPQESAETVLWSFLFDANLILLIHLSRRCGLDMLVPRSGQFVFFTIMAVDLHRVSWTLLSVLLAGQSPSLTVLSSVMQTTWLETSRWSDVNRDIFYNTSGHGNMKKFVWGGALCYPLLIHRDNVLRRFPTCMTVLRVSATVLQKDLLW